MVGVQPEQFLFEDRSEANVEAFSEHTVDLNETLGRRARDLQLPPCWEKDGFYIIIMKKGQMKIQHRMTKEERDIPDIILQHASDPKDIQVDMNFSEMRATVRCRSGNQWNAKSGAKLFGVEGTCSAVVVRASKMRKIDPLALQDGEAG